MRWLLLLLIPSLALADAGLDDRLARVELRLLIEEDSALHLQHADLLRRADRFEQAEAALDIAATLDAAPGLLAFRRAELARDRGQQGESLRWLRESIDRGGPTEAHLQLADQLQSTAPNEALDQLDQALLERSTPDLHLRRARLAASLGRDPDPVLVRGIEQHGAIVLRLERVTLLGPRRPEAALAELDAMLAGHPGQAEWLLLKGDLLASVDPDRARAAHEAALAATLNRRRSAAAANQLLRARALLALGRAAEARAVLAPLDTPAAELLLATLETP